MVPPSGVTAIPEGLSNPLESSVVTFPPSVILRIRLLPSSAVYTMPSESTATPIDQIEPRGRRATCRLERWAEVGACNGTVVAARASGDPHYDRDRAGCLIELLDLLVHHVRDVDVSGCVDCHGPRRKQPRGFPDGKRRGYPHDSGYEVRTRSDLSDRVVASVRDVEGALGVHCHAARIVELRFGCLNSIAVVPLQILRIKIGLPADARHRGPGSRGEIHLPNRMRLGICNIGMSVMNRYAVRTSDVRDDIGDCRR